MEWLNLGGNKKHMEFAKDTFQLIGGLVVLSAVMSLFTD